MAGFRGARISECLAQADARGLPVEAFLDAGVNGVLWCGGLSSRGGRGEHCDQAQCNGYCFNHVFGCVELNSVQDGFFRMGLD